RCALFFFFQAEDGIRVWSVTGVQTCALPIFHRLTPTVPLLVGPASTVAGRAPAAGRPFTGTAAPPRTRPPPPAGPPPAPAASARSEERRVGKERGGRAGAAPANE